MTTKPLAAGNGDRITYVDPGHLWELVANGQAVKAAIALGWEPGDLSVMYSATWGYREAIQFIANFVAGQPHG